MPAWNGRQTMTDAKQQSAKHWTLAMAAPDLLTELETAVARIQLANDEGNPILSAWLPDARAAIAKARNQ